MIFHISLDEICYIREELIDRYGGLHGVVDIGRVDAVLYLKKRCYCSKSAGTGGTNSISGNW
ncbi:hypothetical protein [Photorhabdus stackebrandtii]|uniref:Uncharacterized protein n=2 Tax=Photorhabdus TaxID=29487 RepID=A0A7X5TM55_9GAMM|nr:hypothetical protein [Photorhabdus stackebrandtii]ETS29263.1 hypothetical protein PTE_04485 [Photorhabdus khanii NC19]NHB97383.1 hypothetical protein [Photorhabdus stackebrandtii]